ncbi:hypothetical protein [Vulcaniibacterium gelatinicum]|uniref:hypothetical protein n=1 Tax=Vulcaniibacterium gelatinicum TaxID=2598725 RepID=UPI0011C79471|nr:hypothetical protein [Vulcaniibacterium gelatinicum]
MARLRTVTLLLLAALALPLSAQQGNRPIEQEMTPEQFKAAGLDKLTPEELANLNAWLGRKLDAETSQAVAQERQRLDTERTRSGRLLFRDDDPIESRLVGPFRGFEMKRVYTLENGQVWKQVEPASLPGVRLDNPKVRLKPSLVGGVWYLQIEGYGPTAKVKRIK